MCVCVVPSLGMFVYTENEERERKCEKPGVQAHLKIKAWKVPNFL